MRPELHEVAQHWKQQHFTCKIFCGQTAIPCNLVPERPQARQVPTLAGSCEAADSATEGGEAAAGSDLLIGVPGTIGVAAALEEPYSAFCSTLRGVLGPAAAPSPALPDFSFEEPQMPIVRQTRLKRDTQRESTQMWQAGSSGRRQID